MRLGIIGGTALEALVLEESCRREVQTPWGNPSAVPLCGRLGATEICFINRHGADHSLPPHRVNYRANIAAMELLAVDSLIAINAVGGITADLIPGQWLVPDQLVDYTWGREHTFSDGPENPLLHIDFTRPFCPALRQSMLEVAGRVNFNVVDGGTFAVTQGPRLETAAEIARLERDGCDIVGMTSMPEAALAREKGIPYAALALVVNPAAGKSDRDITMEEIGGVMSAAVPGLLSYLSAFASNFSS